MKRSVVAAAVVLGLFVVTVVFWPGGRGPVPVSYGKDACARCSMLLSQPGFAGELRDRRGRLSKYDDLGCLLLDVWAGGKVSGWVEDHAQHQLVRLADATFVRSAELQTPMGYGIVAFADAALAQRFADEHGAALVSVPELKALRPTLEKAGKAAAEVRAPDARPLSVDDAAAGKAAYLRECSACHGERGEGDGPAAAFLEPRPRNFTKKLFKLRTTANGAPPATADILRTLEQGIPGTAMPPFAFLPAEERRQLAAQVLHFAGLLEQKEPRPLDDPGEPPPSTPERVRRGQELYAQLYCHSCHGPRGKGDGPSALLQKDNDGRPVAPRDFTSGIFRGGNAPKDLYWRFVTGMDGSPMPSFADAVSGDDRWALVDYVMSLKVEPKPQVYAADALAAGRQLAAKYSCRGCHVLDDGHGGAVGPDLRISGQKLSSDWVRKFLRAPRDVGKIYPWRVQRMPHLGLSDEETEVGARYLATMGKRPALGVRLPDPSSFTEAQLNAGKGIFMLRCTECHTLGRVIETPLKKQQGPDLINVASRVDFAWAKRWITDPKKIDPATKMTNPGITAGEVEAVRQFVWKTSMDSLGDLAKR